MGTDVHVCLLLFSSIIALTVEAYPARYKIKPSPIRRYRSTAFTYPHRKLSRPWLIKLQEELWKDGPSGDGPDDDGRSSLILPIVSRINQISKTNYETRSPSAEDFFSHQTEPFPTIIDTVIEEPSSFPEEFVSRTSLFYEGPSSLLNSFIFRPKLPYSSLSFIETPVIEEASDFLNVIPSYMDKSSVPWNMSPRQTLSETLFNEFFITTVISAINIESETTHISYANISYHRLPSELPSNFTEESPAVTNEAKNEFEAFSSAENIVNQKYSPYSEENSFYTKDNVLITSSELIDAYSTKILDSQMFLSSDVDVNFLENDFYSNILTTMPYTSICSHTHILCKTLILSPSAHTSEITDSYLNQIHSLDNSFSNQILHDLDETFYTKMSFKSLITSSVQATLTVAEDKSKLDNFITPHSREHEISSTHSFFSVDMRDINPILKSSEFENLFSNYISASFSFSDEKIPVVSFLPTDKITIVGNIISREDIETHLKTLSFTYKSKEHITSSNFELSYPFISSVRTFLFDNERTSDTQSSLNDFKSFILENTYTKIKEITPPIPFMSSYSITEVPPTEQVFTLFSTDNSPQIFHLDSEIMKIVSDRNKEDIISTSLDTLTNLQPLDSISSSVLTPYTIISGILYSRNSFSDLLSSTETQSYSQLQSAFSITPYASDIKPASDEISRENGIVSEFSTEFIDLSTHHVTVRSLNENSFVDINESTLLQTDSLLNYYSTDTALVISGNNLKSENRKESKSEDILSISNNLKPTESFEEIFKTVESTIDYFSLARTTMPEFSSSSFENSIFFENPDIRPSLSSLFIKDKYTKITPTNIFNSYNLEELSEEIYRELVRSSLRDSDKENKATKALSGLYERSIESTDLYASTETVFILSDKSSENKYFKTYVNALDSESIVSSLTFPYLSNFFESTKVALLSTPQTDVHEGLDKSYVQKKSSEYLISSLSNHFSKDMFHSSDILKTEYRSTDEVYSDIELRTRTTLKRSPETDSVVNITSTSDFIDLVTDQSGIQLNSNDISVPATLNPYSVSEYIKSKIDTEIDDLGHTKNVATESFISYDDYLPQFSHPEIISSASDAVFLEENIKTDFSYDFYSELPLLSVHYRSTLDQVFDTNDILVTSSFSPDITEFSTHMSYFPFSIASNTKRQEYTSPTFESMLHSEISLSFSESVSDINTNLNSVENIYLSSINVEDQLNTFKRTSSFIYDLHSEAKSKMSESPFTVVSSFFPPKETNLYSRTPEVIPSDLATTWEEYTLIDKLKTSFPTKYIESSIHYKSTLSPSLKSEDDFQTSEFSDVLSDNVSENFNISTAYISSFISSIEITTFDQILHQVDSSQETISTYVSASQFRAKMSSSENISHFSSGSFSKLYPITEITPTKTTELKGTVSINQTFTDDSLHSKISSIELQSSINILPDLNVKENTVFNQNTPELTPFLSTTVLKQSSCEHQSCTDDSKTEIPSSYAITHPLPISNLSALISPTMSSDFGSKQLISTISLNTISTYSITITKSEESLILTESKNIKQDFTDQKTDLQSKDFDYSFKQTIELPSKNTDLKNIETDYSIKTTLATPFFLTTSVVHQPSTPVTIKSEKVTMSSSTFDKNHGTSVPPEEISTPIYDIEMASVLAISSFFGSNSSRNASSGFENSGISEDDWSTTEVKPTPPFDLTLFKDNNYWILTVLETPMRGHLPENFSHTLEVRLANAYGEAFRLRYPKQEGSSEPIIVKILSLTNDLLLSQLNVVYVVEKGGILLPAHIASDLFNFLRHEQLREFLGLYAILKAKPYRPDDLPETKAISSTIPVVTIVCSILGFLLLLFCCFCVYCRCCRPKQASDASPTSSASGSLQRSLAKHGQHNRKHLFQEMAHHLTSEIVAAHRKIESPAKDLYYPEKEPSLPGKKLPPLSPTEQAEAIDKAARMLKMLENKDASTSPVQKHSRDRKEFHPDEASTMECKKSLPKQKKRRKTKEAEENKSTKIVQKSDKSDSKSPTSIPENEKQRSVTKESRESPDSGTSSRHTSSSPASVPEKMIEEAGSDGSNAELLPPVQDLIAKSKAESEAAVADTQDHLSRVRQRISEILDDAFALANGRKFYGSMRSKKIDPATEMFPRYSSVRSQSAAECSLTSHEEKVEDEERRPISEGAQNLLGTITDDGHLITKPPPKLVWDNTEFEVPSSDAVKHPDVTEAHNRHVNFFPFQQQSNQQQIPSTSFSQPMSEMQRTLTSDMTSSSQSTINALREVASEIYTAHSSKIHPAATDQYDEIDIVSALKEGEPVIELIQAIKDELQKFSGSMHGTHNGESKA